MHLRWEKYRRRLYDNYDLCGLSILWLELFSGSKNEIVVLCNNMKHVQTIDFCHDDEDDPGHVYRINEIINLVANV